MMKKRIHMFLTLLVIAVILVSCKQEQKIEQKKQPEYIATPVQTPEPNQDISFTEKKEVIVTEDSKKIAASFYVVKEKRPVFILLHMLGNEQTSYDSFVQKILERNYNVITFDFRGHGYSEGALSTLTDKDVKAFEKDLEAVLLSAAKKENVDTKNIVLIGASIGANVALNHASKDPNIKYVVLLSPGLNYRGITTNQSIKKYGDRPIEIVASVGDRYSYDSSRALADETPSKKASLRTFQGNAHGTNLLTEKLMKDLLEDIKVEIP